MIHDHQIYTWLKQLYEKSDVISKLDVVRVEMADYPEVPGPGPDEGGLKNFLPAILITKGESNNSWGADVNSNNQDQEYYIKIKYARAFKDGDNPHVIMPAEISQIMNVLKNNFTLDQMDLSGTAAPLSMSFWGDWNCQAESLVSGTTFIGIGFFQIKISLNQSLI